MSVETLELQPPSGRVTAVFVVTHGRDFPDPARSELRFVDGYLVREDLVGAQLVFANPVAATLWCLDLLEAAPAVSVGMHFGMVLVRQARHGAVTTGDATDWSRSLSELVRPGEILATERLWGAVKDAIRRQRRVSHLSLGEHRLVGLESAQRLVLLGSSELRSFLLDTVSQRRTNLPTAVPTFAGRDEEILRLDALLEGGARVVSILGPGGFGKTRLAWRYGALHLHEYATRGGVWVCDLSEVRSIDALVSAVARALRIPLSAGGLKGLNQVGHALASRGAMLLVFDSFEQVGDKGLLAVEQWQRHAPDVRFLVTTRVRIQPQTESLELGPLDLRASTDLFALRASELKEDFSLAAHEEAVESIVARLEGVPLAIELAASWIALMPPAAIDRRLEENLQFLSGAPARRGLTMSTVISWSWRLLEPWERSALAQCAVFRGGFSLEAVEGVLDLTLHPDAPDPLGVVMALRDKSLIRTYQPVDSPDGFRFSMYEVVREFAEQKAMSFGIHRLSAHRHAAWYLERGRTWREQTRGPHSPRAMQSLALERENLLAAFRYSSAVAPDAAVGAVLILQPLHEARGPFDQALLLLDEAVQLAARVDRDLRVSTRCARVDALISRGHLDRARADLDAAWEELSEIDQADSPRLLGMVHRRYGLLDARAADFPSAMAHLMEAIGYLEQVEDRRLTARALGDLAEQQFVTGAWEDANETFRRALTTIKGLGDRRGEGHLAASFGNLVRARGEDAEPLYRRALQASAEVEDLPSQARFLSYLGSMYLDRGESTQALDHYERAQHLQRQVGDVHAAALLSGNVGRVHHQEGRLPQALDHYAEALLTLTGLGDRRFVAIFQSNEAAVRHEVGEVGEALRAYEGALEELRELGDPRFEGLVLGRLSAALADIGDGSRARELLVEARDRIELVGDPAGRAVLRLHLAHLEVAEGRHRMSEAVKRVVRQATVARKPASWDLRVALRLLRAALRR